MAFSIVTLAVFHEWHVTRDLACPPEDIKECVQQAWLQVKSRLTCLASLLNPFQSRVAPGDLPVAIFLKRKFLSRFARS